MAKKIAMIASGGDVFLRYEGLESVGLIDEAVGQVFEKYKDTWLALKQADIENSLSGSSEEDIMSYKLSQAITRMTLTDVEKYLTKYPVLKEQKDLGMSGSLHMYEVTLAKENMLSMMEEFMREATKKDMTATDRKSLEDSLAEINILGVV
jgi:DNA primase large subunit